MNPQELSLQLAEREYPDLNLGADKLKTRGTAAITDAIRLDRREVYARATEKYLDLLLRIRKGHEDGCESWLPTVGPELPCTCSYASACKECDEILKPLK